MELIVIAYNEIYPGQIIIKNSNVKQHPIVQRADVKKFNKIKVTTAEATTGRVISDYYYFYVNHNAQTTVKTIHSGQKRRSL